jgi:cytochrome bd ubiquinol oxidase subunit I
MEMDTVTISRIFFGTALAFHIIFATLAVGIPVLVLISELMYLKTNDLDYRILARRWIKGFAILLGVAIPSGTIVAVLLSLLWPGFMRIVGQVISVPFQIEIFAFFLEALFMSIYVYAADRLPNWLRILSVFFVLLGATASAVLITSANSWMTTPAGFTMLPDGTITNVDTWKAFFNPNFFYDAYHVTVSAYMTGAFVLAAVSAYQLLRAKNKRVQEIHRKAFAMSLIVALVTSFLTYLSGHSAAQALHRHAPEKLAAAEGLFETQKYAPLAIGGYVDPETHRVKFGIEIPYLLSFLAGNRFDTEVKGLNEFPPDTWPPFYTHTLFNLMVGIGVLLFILAVIGVMRWIRTRNTNQPYPRWLLWSFVLSGPLAILGIEFGWIFSCSGRQPFVIYGVLRTSEAATKTGNVGFLFFFFVGLYVLLGVLTIVAMRSYFRRNPIENELKPMRSETNG